MAKIALAIGIGVAGALTGGLAAAGFGIFAGTFAGGSILGGALLGGSIGLSAGRALGNIFFPQNSSVSGPRIQDGQISTSANGSPRPFGYGGFLVGAQIIWATPLKETKTQTTQSAKGGPSQTTLSYSYTMSFAFAFCEVPIGSLAHCTRIWGDAKLIYDATSKGSVTSNKFATGIGNNTAIVTPVLYPGSTTQLPDPTIQAHVGINSTPAFRGTHYGVYTDFPLANFGNRLPNIRGEVSIGITNSYLYDIYPPTSVTDPYGGTGPGPYPPWAVYVDTVNRAAYVLETPGMVVERIDLNADNKTPLPAWSSATMELVGTQILDSNGNVQCVTSTSGDALTGGSAPTWGIGLNAVTVDHHVIWGNIGAGPEAIAVTNQGVLTPYAGSHYSGGGGNLPLTGGVDTAGFIWRTITGIFPDNGFPDYLTNAAIKFDPRTFNEIARFWMPQAPSAYQFQKTHAGENLVVFTVPWTGTHATAHFQTDKRNIGVQDYIPVALGAIYDHPSIALDNNSRAYILTHGGSYKYLIAIIDQRGFASNYFSMPSGGEAPAIEFLSNATVGTPKSILYDSVDDSLLLFTDTGYIIKMSCSTFAILATSAGQVFGLGASYEEFISTFYPAGQVPADGLVRLFTNQHGVDEIAVISSSTLVQEQVIGLSNWIPLSPTGVRGQSYDVQTNSLFIIFNASYPFTYRLYLDRQAVPGQSLDAVVGDILTRGGMDPGDMDLTALSSIIVRGYLVARNPDVKGALAPLMQAYFFDLPETDNKIKAVLRGASASTNIPEADLGMLGQDAKLVPSEAQEADLPKTLEVNYIDPALDYQSGKQKRQRHGRVKKTRQKLTLELPVTLHADEAAQLAAKALQVIWDEKDGYEMKLWRAVYLAMDPSDVIQFTYNGDGYAARLLKTTSGVDLTMEVTVVSEDARSYNSTIAGATSDGFVSQTVEPLPPTLLFVLDLPLLQDTDAPAPGLIGYYFAMAAVGLGWTGGVLYRSIDADHWDPVGFADDQPAIGSISATLPAPRAVWTWDETSSITVYLMEGTLSSTTDLNVLNGANAALIGDEVVQYVNATLIAPNTYTLSRFLRGRRGTEYAVGTHLPGETFISLGGGGIHRNNISTANLGIPQFFKAVTVGSAVTNANETLIQEQGNDLKPYSVVEIAGTRDMSGNLTVTWERRTRIGGAWLDGTGTVPLSEDAESYVMEVRNIYGAFGRRFISIPTTSQVYTAADQTTDFGSPQAQIDVVIYQVSAQVGNGFAAGARV